MARVLNINKILIRATRRVVFPGDEGGIMAWHLGLISYRESLALDLCYDRALGQYFGDSSRITSTAPQNHMKRISLE